MNSRTEELIKTVLGNWGEYCSFDSHYDADTKTMTRSESDRLDVHSIIAKTGCSQSTAYLIRDRAEYLHRTNPQTE